MIKTVNTLKMTEKFSKTKNAYQSFGGEFLYELFKYIQ